MSVLKCPLVGPPVMIAHDRDDTQRCAELCEDMSDIGMVVMLHHQSMARIEIAQKHDQIRRQRIGTLDDLLGPPERHERLVEMRIGQNGDAQRQCRRPVRQRRPVGRDTQAQQRLDDDTVGAHDQTRTGDARQYLATRQAGRSRGRSLSGWLERNL